MKSLRLTMVMALLVAAMTTVTARTDGQHLQYVEGDSVELADFFWNNLTGAVKQQYLDLKRERRSNPSWSKSRLSRCVQEWDALWSQTELTGALIGQDGLETREASAFHLAQLSEQLFLKTRDGRYGDALERTLYNELAGAVYTSGQSAVRRQACEMIGRVRDLIYAFDRDNLYVNLHVRSEAHIKSSGLDLHLSLLGSMPWYNRMMLVLKMPADSQHLTVHIRVPAWIEGQTIPAAGGMEKMKYKVYVNGQPIAPKIEKGFLVIDSVWQKDNSITLDFRTPILRIITPRHPDQMALQRGALVFSLQNMSPQLSINTGDKISSRFDKDRHTLVLSSQCYDAQGAVAGEYEAVPYFWSPERNWSSVYVPAKP